MRRYMCVRVAGVLLVISVALAACGSIGGAAPAGERAVAPVGGEPSIAAESRVLDAGERGLPEVGKPAPDFEYTRADGSTVRLSDLRGKKVIINFWATWCLPCREEMPDLQQVYEDHAGEVVIIGVNRLEAVDVIAPFAEEVDVTFDLVANPAGDIADRYGTVNLPTTYFIHSDGTVALRKIGVMDYAFITEQVAQLQ